MSQSLTPREARFVEEYARLRNGKQAALAAGWSEKSASAVAHRLLREPAIVAALEAQGVAVVLGVHPPGQIRKARVFVKRGLTLLQQRFVEAYLVCANATEAARRAGLPGKRPEFAGAKMMRRPGVAEAIAAEREASARRTGITVDRVKRELARLAFVEIGDIAEWDGDALHLRPREEISADDRAAIAELKVKSGKNGSRTTIRLHSKQAALVALAKHLGMYEKGAARPPEPAYDAKAELRARLQRIMAGGKEEEEK